MQNNYRAHKRALKKAKYKASRNTYGKMQKKLQKEMQRYNERLDVQISKMFNNITSKIDSSKVKLNVMIANWKFKRKQDKDDFVSLVLNYAIVQKISIVLAFLIIFNVLIASNEETLSSIQNSDSLEEESTTLQSAISGAELSFEQINWNMLASWESKMPELVIEPRELTNEEMFEVVCDKYDIQEFQLNEIIAYMLKEGGENCYDNVYDATSALYNRTGSLKCINFVNNISHINNGYNIYEQLICKGQFTVSREAALALAQTDMTVYSGYSAVLKMLYTEEPSHNFYRFVAPHLAYKYPRKNYLLDSGNYFFEELQDWDRVNRADYLPNYAKYHEEDPSVVYQKEHMENEKSDESNNLLPEDSAIMNNPLFTYQNELEESFHNSNDDYARTRTIHNN